MGYILALLRLNTVVGEEASIKYLMFIFGTAFVLYLFPAFLLFFYPVIKAVLAIVLLIVLLNVILPRPLFSIAFSAGAGGLSSGLGLMLTWFFVLARYLVTFIVWCYPVMLILLIVRLVWVDFRTGGVAGVENSHAAIPLYISDFFQFTGAGIGFGLIYAYAKKFLTK